MKLLRFISTAVLLGAIVSTAIAAPTVPTPARPAFLNVVTTANRFTLTAADVRVGDIVKQELSASGARVATITIIADPVLGSNYASDLSIYDPANNSYNSYFETGGTAMTRQQFATAAAAQMATDFAGVVTVSVNGAVITLTSTSNYSIPSPYVFAPTDDDSVIFATMDIVAPGSDGDGAQAWLVIDTANLNNFRGYMQLLPSFGKLAASSSWDDLIGKPTFAVTAFSSDWNNVSNKPTFATVATSGKFTDLTAASRSLRFLTVRKLGPRARSAVGEV
jgi:hypothetical protein